MQIPVFSPLDRLDVDLLHLLRSLTSTPTTKRASDVVIVAIDEKTYRTPPFQGLPKVMWTPQIATVQDNILNAGARIFAWDLILPTSAARYVANKRFDTPLLRSLAKGGRKEGRILLGNVSIGDQIVGPHRAFILSVGGPKNIRSLNLPVDADGVVRSLTPHLTTKDATGKLHQIPNFAAEIALRSGQYSLPDREQGTVLNFTPPDGGIRIYSFADLANCNDADYLTHQFKDKIVLFGAVLDIEDRKLAANRFTTASKTESASHIQCDGTSYTVSATDHTLIPGVFIHATAVDNLIKGTYLTPTNTATKLVVSLMMALIAAALAISYKSRSSLIAILVFAGLWTAIATLAFHNNQWIFLTQAWAVMALSWTGGFGYRFWTVERERSTIRASLARYLDKDVLDTIIEKDEVPTLGGERREMTAFFSDIAGFSALSEKMTPQELVQFLNIYFEIIGKEIKTHGGIIERFVGDAVIALFGAPLSDEDHALNSVRCALAIDNAFAVKQDQLGLPPGMEALTRIGLNSGDMVIGNVGAEQRFAYTAMGDNVNLAARLESGGKQFGTTILVGEATKNLCGDNIVFRHVDKIRVVGRANPVDIYEPLGLADNISDQALDLKKRYEAALKMIQIQEFSTARARLEELAKGGDLVSTKTLGRLAALEASPPGDDWDGVTNLTEK